MPNDTVLTPPADNQDPGNKPDVGNVTLENKVEGAPDWRGGLPEDLRGEKMFENIKGKDWTEAGPVLAKGYRDAQKLVGSGITRVPGKDAKPEDVAKWKTDNLGKLAEAGLVELPPAAADKYEAKLKVPEGRTADPVLMKTFYDRAHAVGISNRQAQAMLDMYSEMEGASRESLGGSVKATMAVLEKEWGGAAESNIKMAYSAVAEVGGEELIGVLEATGLGNHPALVRAFARVGKILAEDNPVFADTVRGGTDEAKTKLAAIMNDSKHPYWVDDHPGHKAAVAEVYRHNQIIHSAV